MVVACAATRAGWGTAQVRSALVVAVKGGVPVPFPHVYISPFLVAIAAWRPPHARRARSSRHASPTSSGTEEPGLGPPSACTNGHKLLNKVRRTQTVYVSALRFKQKVQVTTAMMGGISAHSITTIWHYTKPAICFPTTAATPLA
jgi:hypothetical protein